jgi:cell division transport system permease protein
LSIRTFLTHHRQALVSSIRMWGDAPLATFMTFMVIAVALTLPALFWLLSFNMKHLTTSWQQGQHVEAYLKPGVSDFLQNQILTRVRETEGVERATLISPKEGLRALEEQEGLSDVGMYLEKNPLPAVIEIVPEEALDTPEKLGMLMQVLKTDQDIEQVKLDMQWVTKLYAILGFLSALAKSLMMLLGFAVIIIIGSTLRLAIERRHEEILVLKLIGATDAYIARPFLYSGLWYGLGGALIALLLVMVFVSSLMSVLDEVLVLYHIQYTGFTCSVVEVSLFILSSVVLGLLGAYLSVKRQVSLIEP